MDSFTAKVERQEKLIENYNFTSANNIRIKQQLSGKLMINQLLVYDIPIIKAN